MLLSGTKRKRDNDAPPPAPISLWDNIATMVHLDYQAEYNASY
jgi:hypothetical protein